MDAIGSTHPTPWTPSQRRTVLLRHTLPDGSWHFDWLIQTHADDEARAATFRLVEPVHTLDEADLELTRLPDHRARYFTYEGPVSGGRGVVARVASGIISLDTSAPEALEGHVQFQGRPPQRVRLTQTQAPLWRLRLNLRGDA
ncbi:MAG: hypothetical protein AAF138_02160 [Planctomycetota bacterium]